MRRGFTLIEVLVALALVAMLSAALAGFVRDLRVQQRSMMRWAEDSAAGDAMIEGLERDLLTCIAVWRGGSGVRGDGTTLWVVSRGVLAQGALPTAGVVASEYQLSGTELRARRWDAASEPGPGWDTLSTRLARLRLRYHDGMQWRSEFDSAADGLPRAVEVAMWFGAAPTAEPVESEGFGVPEQRETRWGRPDRLRVIAVPDGGGEGVTP